jgi:hypothetical protein
MHLFFTALHTGLLGVLLALAPRLWYPANAAGAGLWGLTPLEDQQLAGIAMAVSESIVFFTAFTIYFVRFLAEEDAALEEQPDG